jgi:hypothetical protein
VLIISGEDAENLSTSEEAQAAKTIDNPRIDRELEDTVRHIAYHPKRRGKW